MAGVRVAMPQSTLDAAQVFVPGLFVVLVTWIGARFALDGKIGTGELVAFYGYAAFLVIPLRTAAEAVDKMTRSLVGARRMLDVLAIEPDVRDPAQPAEEPPPGVPLSDPQSGLVVEPGHADRARLVRAARDGRGRRSDRAVRRRRARARRRPPGRPARRHGAPPHRRQRGRPRAVLRARCAHALDPWQRADDGAVDEAIAVANAEDVVEALPEGLDDGHRRARPLVLGRPAPAPGAHARAARRPGDPRPRRADERGRRAHRGADRTAAARGARRPDDGRGDGEPARARPRRPRRAGRGRAGHRAGRHRELLRENARYREIVTRGAEEVNQLLPIAEGPRAARAGAAARPQPPPRRSPVVIGLQRRRRGRRPRRAGAARRARPVGAERDDDQPRRQARGRARRVPARADDL